MISDRGSIQTAAVSVESALAAYRKILKIISLILLIVGTLGVIAYIALSTVWEMKYNTEPLWIKALLVFAVPFTLGLIGTITIVRLHRRELKEALYGTAEFFDDCFFYRTQKSADKVEYSDAVLKRDIGNFGYICIYRKGIYMPFSTEDLTAGELNAIRAKFRQAVPDGETAVKLEKYKKE